MINKIQKILLTKYPIIWNTRIIPILMAMLILHIVFFFIGYAANGLDFKVVFHFETPFSRSFPQIFLLITLLCIIIFIFWIISYSKNNAFRAFYPRTTFAIFREFLSVVLIVASIGLLPVTAVYGGLLRWQNTETLENCYKNIDLLNHVEMLIPSDQYFYFTGKNNISNDSYMYGSYEYSDEESGTNDSLISILRKDPNNYSLLNHPLFEVAAQHDLSSKNRNHAIKEVKKCLKNNDATKIKSLMSDFVVLLVKNDLPVNITVDEWFKRIYIPDKYLIGKEQIIFKEIRYSSGCEKMYDSENNLYYVADVIGDTLGVYSSDLKAQNFIIKQPNIPYLPYTELRQGYQHIIDAHTTNNSVSAVFHICFYFVLIISLILFAIRLSSVKQFFLGVLYLGILLFVSFIIMESFVLRSQSGMAWYSGFWLTIFAVLGLYMVFLIKNKSPRRFNKPVPVMLILLSILVYPLSFLFVEEIYHSSKNYLERNTLEWSYTWSYLSVIILMFGIIYLIREWKTLSEE